jgi:hypothetical protein
MVTTQPSLFRQEAIDFQQHNRHWGQVAALQPLSTKVMTWLIAAAVVLIITFLSLAEYARKETVIGSRRPPALRRSLRLNKAPSERFTSRRVSRSKRDSPS